MLEVSAPDWRVQRRTGLAVIAAASTVALLLWMVLVRVTPPLDGVATAADRMLIALKCLVLTTLFTLVLGIEAVAHERLQTAAFDPIAPHHGHRLAVNQRYLQNTLEQLVVFAIGLVGLAAISPAAMRLVPATATVWTLSRIAFWMGYHRSAALRALGAPSMMIGLILLLFLGWRIGVDVAGPVGGGAVLLLFLAGEAMLFWTTREKEPGP